MSERIRFHLDENVKSAVARELRRRGIDVTTTLGKERSHWRTITCRRHHS